MCKTNKPGNICGSKAKAKGVTCGFGDIHALKLPDELRPRDAHCSLQGRQARLKCPVSSRRISYSCDSRSGKAERNVDLVAAKMSAREKSELAGGSAPLHVLHHLGPLRSSNHVRHDDASELHRVVISPSLRRKCLLTII
jgi:hypothetical protein